MSEETAPKAPQEDPLQSMAKRLGVQHIKWVGKAPSDNLEDIYARLERILTTAKDKSELDSLPSQIYIKNKHPETAPFGIYTKASRTFCVINLSKADDEIQTAISKTVREMGHEAQSKENPTAVQTTVAERVYTAAPKTVELNGITYTLGAEKTIDASDYPIFEATDPEGQAVEIAFVPKDQGIVPANRRHIQDQEGQSIYISAPLPSPTERIDGYEDLVRAIGENRAKFAPTIKAIIEHHLRIAIEEANEGRTIVRFKYALAPNLEDPKPLYITLDVQPGEADTKVNTNLVEQNQKTCLAQFFQWYKIDKLKDVLSERQIGHLKALEKADAPATRHNIIRGFLQSTTGPQAAPPPEEVLATENKVAETSVDQVIPTTSSEPPVAPNRLRRLVPWALGTAAAMTTAFALNRGGQEKPVAPTPPGITATTKAQITGVVSQPPKPPSQPSIAPAAGSWLKQRF